MALVKKQTVDRIEVIENGCVQVRTRTDIFEDAQILSTTYHRHIVAPGDDFSNEDTRVQAVCKSVHTDAVKNEFAKAMTLDAAVK